MDSINNLLNQNWLGVLIGLIGIVLAVVSLITAYVFYGRSKPKPGAGYQARTRQMLGSTSTSSEIEILFRGKKVPQVTQSLVAIWNYGNTTLERKQMVEADPLRIIVSPTSEVLDTVIVRVTREVNEFYAAKTPANEVGCGFDWLDNGDGALIKVLHTGDTVRVAGTLRGVPTGIANLGRLATFTRKPTRSDRASKVFVALGFMLIVSFFMFIGANLFLLGLEAYSMHKGPALGVMVIGFLAFVAPATLALPLITRRRIKPPESLRLTEDEW